MSYQNFACCASISMYLIKLRFALNLASLKAGFWVETKFRHGPGAGPKFRPHGFLLGPTRTQAAGLMQDQGQSKRSHRNERLPGFMRGLNNEYAMLIKFCTVSDGSGLAFGEMFDSLPYSLGRTWAFSKLKNDVSYGRRAKCVSLTIKICSHAKFRRNRPCFEFEFCYIVTAAEDVLDGGTKKIWTPSVVARLSFHEAAI